MKARPTVVVTGANGEVARQILPSLAGLTLRLVDLQSDEGSGVTPLDLFQPEFDQVLRGADVVIHCAYKHSAPGDCYDSSVRHIDKFDAENYNLVMCNRVFRASLEAGVRRVVVASSNHAADWLENHVLHENTNGPPLDPYSLPLADNFYGWSKASYEHLGFLYASGSFGRALEIVMLRIGACRDLVLENYYGQPPAPPDGPQFLTGLPKYERDLGAWVSPSDLGRAFLAATTNNISGKYGVPWSIVYAISNNTRAFWSLANASEIGYEPRDNSEFVYRFDINRLRDNQSLGK